jgi:hypothetical protein
LQHYPLSTLRSQLFPTRWVGLVYIALSGRRKAGYNPTNALIGAIVKQNSTDNRKKYYGISTKQKHYEIDITYSLLTILY